MLIDVLCNDPAPETTTVADYCTKVWLALQGLITRSQLNLKPTFSECSSLVFDVPLTKTLSPPAGQACLFEHLVQRDCVK